MEKNIFLENYLNEIPNYENRKNIKKEKSSTNIDTESLVKVFLNWLAGGIISLMPTFILISLKFRPSNVANTINEMMPRTQFIGGILKDFFFKQRFVSSSHNNDLKYNAGISIL